MVCMEDVWGDFADGFDGLGDGFDGLADPEDLLLILVAWMPEEEKK